MIATIAESWLLFGAGVAVALLSWILVAVIQTKVELATIITQLQRFAADLESEKANRADKNSEFTRRLEKLETKK